MPLRYALWLALPLQLVMLWVAHLGWTQYQRNLTFAASDASPPFDVDQWRYFTKNELSRSFGRTVAPDPALASGVETLELTIDRGHVGSLNSDLPESGKSTYYPAVLTIDGVRHRVKTRYMGDNHWHWLYPQKSWKVKTKKGDPIRDRRAFNVKNPPTIGTIEDVIANELAAEAGLISPQVWPVKLFVNGAYSGLHLWWDLADESLLRRNERMPGSIYSGDGAPRDEQGVGALFRKAEYWVKDSARNAEQADDRADIELLITAINEMDGAAFRALADDHMDIDRFASFTALDRLLGGQHHDYNHNHKIYFDPYRGRFEPIEWDFAYWRLPERNPGLDQTTNPLLTRIREQPEFELRIQRRLLELTNEITPEWMRRRLQREAERIRSALSADAYRDARDNRGSNKLRLAAVHCAYFSLGAFDAEIEWLANEYARRHEWLRERLADSRLAMSWQQLGDGVVSLNLASSGLVGQRLDGVTVTTAADSVALVRDENGNGRADAGERVVATAKTEAGKARLEAGELILPGLTRTERERSWLPLYGTFDLSPAALRYPYLLTAEGGQISAVEVRATNALTGADVQAEVVEQLPEGAAAASFHPWKVPAPPADRTVELGPGVIEITESREFGPETTVVIHPGTTLRLGANVSLEMRGKVLAEGTADAPIVVEPSSSDAPWGVFALHGMGTRGSRFRHCRWQDGSTDKLRMVLRTGMVSIIDTADLAMEHCFIGRNHTGDDALHWGYIDGAVIRDSEFRGARSDAFDIDISRNVEISNCRFIESGNDSVDLMTSQALVTNCSFTNAGDKGISVGEGSKLDLRRSEFDRCVIGVEIKDSSVARVDPETRIRDCDIGVNAYRKNTRYTSGGTLIATELSTSGCKTPTQADARSTLKIGAAPGEAAPNPPRK